MAKTATASGGGRQETRVVTKRTRERIIWRSAMSEGPEEPKLWVLLKVYTVSNPGALNFLSILPSPF